MERYSDSREPMTASVNVSQRRSRRINTPKDSAEGEIGDRARSRDREQSKQRRDRDGRFLKRTRVDGATDEEYNAEEEDGAGANKRELRARLSSPAVFGAAADEVIGAVVPRRARTSLVRRVYAESSSGSEEEMGRLRSSRAMASSLSVGVDIRSSSPKKKMKSSAEKRTNASASGSNSMPPSTTEEDIEMRVVETLLEMMQQSQALKFGEEESVVTDSGEMKRSEHAESVKGEADDLPLQKVQSVNVSVKTEVVDGPQELKSLNIMGSSNACENAEMPTSTERKNVASVVEEKRLLHKDFTVDDIAHSRPDKHKVNVAPQIANKMSENVHKDASAAIQLQKRKEGAVRSNPVSHGMGKPLHDSSSVTNIQWQNLMEQMNQPVSSLRPLSSGTRVWPGALPYKSYTPRLPPLQALARSSAGIQPPPFKFSQPRDKRCTTHQYIARNIRNYQQQMANSLTRRPSDGGVVSPMFLYESKAPHKKPLVGTTHGGQFSAKITSPSKRDKNDAAFTKSNNPHQIQSDSFWRCPGFIFPFGSHRGLADPFGLPRSASSETNATSVGLTFASKEAPSSSSSPYMAMLQSSGCSVPNNIPMPPLKGGHQFAAFLPSHYQQSSPTAAHKQPPPSSKPPTTNKSLQASQQLSKSSANITEHSLLPFPFMMASDKVEYVPPENAIFLLPSMQWHHHQQMMARDQNASQAREKASRSGSATRTEEAPSSPSCRKDVVVPDTSMLRQQLPHEPK